MERYTRRYTELTPRTVARRGTLEIARYGYATIVVRETIVESPKSVFFRQIRPREYVLATLLVLKTLEKERTTRYNIEFKIHHDARMAEQRLLGEELGPAYMAMNKVLKAQPEYIHILRRIAAIKALRYNLANGLIRAKDVPSNLKDIKSTPRPNDKPRASSFEEVLDELEHGNFFPILDTTTGRISFTDCYDEISRLHIDDDDGDYLDPATRRSLSTTTTTTKNGSSRLLLSKLESATTVSTSCDSSVSAM